MTIYNYITIISAVLMTILILIQTRVHHWVLVLVVVQRSTLFVVEQIRPYFRLLL